MKKIVIQYNFLYNSYIYRHYNPSEIDVPLTLVVVYSPVSLLWETSAGHQYMFSHHINPSMNPQQRKHWTPVRRLIPAGFEPDITGKKDYMRGKLLLFYPRVCSQTRTAQGTRICGQENYSMTLVFLAQLYSCWAYLPCCTLW